MKTWRTVWAVFWLLTLFLCGQLAVIYDDYRKAGKNVAEKQAQVADGQAVRTEYRENQRRLWEAEELQRLREEQQEFRRLQAEVEGLRLAARGKQAEAVRKREEQLGDLLRENEQLRRENAQLRADPEFQAAKVEVLNQELRYIAYALQVYAGRNQGQLPPSLDELKYYVPANVFPALEIEKFELLAASAGSTDPHNTPIVRSKSRQPNEANLYLFADWHLEAKSDQ